MTFNMADMLSNPGEAGRNRVLRSSAIEKSEKCIYKTMTAIKSFLNPLILKTKVICSAFHLEFRKIL